jgi:hypothetical protein
MTPDELFGEFEKAFRHRKFIAGLSVALANLLLALNLPDGKTRSFDELVQRFPRRKTTNAGGPATRSY